MRYLYAIILSALTIASANAQSAPTSDDNDTHEEESAESKTGKSVYRLYPTQNMWTFIKLNTATGQLWQVQYSVKEGDYRFETALCLTNKTLDGDEYAGRFSLYKTQNVYNFLLLDRKNGIVWQVQWSQDPSNRFAMPIL